MTPESTQQFSRTTAMWLQWIPDSRSIDTEGFSWHGLVL